MPHSDAGAGVFKARCDPASASSIRHRGVGGLDRRRELQGWAANIGLNSSILSFRGLAGPAIVVGRRSLPILFRSLDRLPAG